MLPHTGLSWLMKVALQIRIRASLNIKSYEVGKSGRGQRVISLAQAALPMDEDMPASNNFGKLSIQTLLCCLSSEKAA